MPLNLLSFTGSKQNLDALLQWRTTNETLISRFEILRSDNNGQSFSVIGTVPAGASNYTFKDAGVFVNKNLVFYRLKIIDIDGSFTYSPIIRLSNNAAVSLTVFPNPVKDVFTVAGLKQNGAIRLFNTEGKLMLHQKVTAQSITIDMSNYSSGIYLLQYDTGNESVTQKIIKN